MAAGEYDGVYELAHACLALQVHHHLLGLFRFRSPIVHVIEPLRGRRRLGGSGSSSRSSSLFLEGSSTLEQILLVSAKSFRIFRTHAAQEIVNVQALVYGGTLLRVEHGVRGIIPDC